MSGHSKWSTIKRQKGIADSKRSAVFTKHARLITVATREGGKDPDMNFRLRLAIDRARAENMPNDNIERAVKAGAGELKGDQMKEVVYEGFGPGGTAIMVRTLTDNTNRTSGEVRNIFNKHGGSLGGHNSVGWMFALQGVVRVKASAVPDHQAFELAAIDLGAEDVREDDDFLMLITSADHLQALRKWVEGQHIPIEAADLEYIPTTTTEITASGREKLFGLFEALEEVPDVTDFFSNDR